MSNRSTKTRRMVLLAMFAALAFVAMSVGRIPIVLWLKYDPKDVIIVFAGLLFGPLSSVIISVAVSLIEMITVSDTGFIGAVMNIISTLTFALPAAIIYKKHRTLGGAVTGLVAGVLLMTAAMILWNYLLTPLYMHRPREEVVKLLVPVFLPFNLFKGLLNAILTLLLYKPAVQGLRRAKLIEAHDGEAGVRAHLGGMLLSVAVLAAACIILLLVMRGIL